MSAGHVALGLRTVVRYWRHREWPKFWREHPRRIARQEFVLDGQVLSEVFDLTERFPPAEENALTSMNPRAAVDQILRLLGQAEPDFEGNRVALLVCPACMDAGCGSLSATIERTSDCVSWSNISWQDATGSEVRPVRGPRVVSFARDQYEDVLTAALSRWQVLAEAQDALGSDASDLVAYPMLAVEEDGDPVHLLRDRLELEGIQELFIHGEIISLVDSDGTEFSYTPGNVPYLELQSTGSASKAAVLKKVHDRATYLHGRNSLRRRPGSSELEGNAQDELTLAFNLAREYSLD